MKVTLIVIIAAIVLMFISLRAQSGEICDIQHYIDLKQTTPATLSQTLAPGGTLNKGISGVSKTFTWRELESAQGVYNFTAVDAYLDALRAINTQYGTNMQLYVGIEWKGRNGDNPLPDYIGNSSAHAYTYGGADRQALHGGKVAKYWNWNTGIAFAALVDAIATRYTPGNVPVAAFGGIKLPETSISATRSQLLPDGFNAPLQRDQYAAIANYAGNSLAPASVIIAPQCFSEDFEVDPLEDRDYRKGVAEFLKLNNAAKNVYVGATHIVPEDQGFIAQVYPLHQDAGFNTPDEMHVSYDASIITYGTRDPDTGAFYTPTSIANWAAVNLNAEKIFWLEDYGVADSETDVRDVFWMANEQDVACQTAACHP